MKKHVAIVGKYTAASGNGAKVEASGMGGSVKVNKTDIDVVAKLSVTNVERKSFEEASVGLKNDADESKLGKSSIPAWMEKMEKQLGMMKLEDLANI